MPPTCWPALAGKVPYTQPGIDIQLTASTGPARADQVFPDQALPDQVFIESKNSLFVFVCFSLSSRNSMASTTPIDDRIRRSTNIF